MRKLGTLILAVGFIFTLVGCSGNTDKPTDLLQFGYITNPTGLGDQAFNDAVYAGLQQAQEEFDIELTVFEPSDVAQIETGMRTLARNGNEVIFAGDSSLSDAVEVISKEFPETIFVIVDGNLPELENVVSLQFKEQENAFLVGAFAARMINEGEKIGFVGGMDIPIIEKFRSGFVLGALEAGMSTNDILVSYTGVFNDPQLGKQTAEAQNEAGATIIFTAAGACNLGVFTSAEELSFYSLGAATGQFNVSNSIIASHIKSVDTLMYRLSKEYIETGSLETGVRVNGLAEGGVDFRYSPFNDENGVDIPQEVKDYIEELREKIIAGDIVVPETTEK